MRMPYLSAINFQDKFQANTETFNGYNWQEPNQLAIHKLRSSTRVYREQHQLEVSTE